MPAHTRRTRRPKHTWTLACGSALLASLPLTAQTPSPGPATQPTLAALREGFLHPPAEARLRCYWWWLNGNTDQATITHDLEEMKAKGFGGALLVDANGADQVGNHPVPAGPTFASPAWVALFTHALQEADRLGLEITFNITSGWNLGGPAVTPEQASKILTYTRTQVTGGTHVVLNLPAPEQKNSFYRQIAVLAYPLQHGPALAPQPGNRQNSLLTRSAAAETGFSMPDASAMLDDGVTGPSAQFAADPRFADTLPANILDLSASTSAAGTLTWNPPAGDWEVLRIGYTDSDARVSTASGAWQGLAIDYLSRPAFESYWQQTVEPLLTAARPYKSLRYLASDSWELGGTNWTADFRQQFQRLRGYDPVPWLPVIAGRIVGDRPQSTRFLTDLRRTVADLIVSEHYDVFAEKARQHGMGVEAESGGPHGAPLDALETFRNAAVPQTEFWSQNPHRATDPERFFTKEAASAANIYGQRFVAQEGETSIGPQWSESLASDLKPSFDMAITEGMNRLVWHEFTSSPASTGLPGQEYFAGTHLNPKITWWPAANAFFDYLNRMQFLMQQGSAVNDVLYFYGDTVPNFVRLKADDPAHVLPGYDYDVTDQDALLRTIRIDGANLVGPSGVRWRVLALPRGRRVSIPVLELAERFLTAGGVVVGLRPDSPSGHTDPATQARFDALADKLWAGCTPGAAHTFGQGRLFCTDNTHQALEALKLAPDFSASTSSGANALAKPYAASNSPLDYVHRRIAQTDLYFVRNGSDHPVSATLGFRVDAQQAERWDPVSATMQTLPATRASGQTTLPLTLPPFGSAVLVFDPHLPPATPAAQTAPIVEPLRLSGSWSLTFEPNRGAPSTPVPMSKLTSWTDSPDPGIRYFSGSATYRARVFAPQAAPGSHIDLHFTEVESIARVRINGKPAGTVWAMPYRLPVDTLLHPGENDVDIEVTNLWPNRIIGDLQPGVSQRYTQTNITKYTANSPLLPSGLLGPVEWIIER